ncbi:MAG: carbohydrate kinase family protein [Candidatus Taylorbacteria bacterium]|nr:carbohydrate kinase family protein [Candidatus Taylorbacteria bacterium]
MKTNLDFLAVGDITTDAFIRLKEASVHCKLNREDCELCVRFADKIPYEFVEVIRAVGNAPNAAVSAARLGLKASLVSNMGDDLNGQECLAVLKKEKVATDYVAVHEGAKTNYHYVLWYEAERTILIKHEPYDYRLPAIAPAPQWLYLSSFRGTDGYYAAITDYLKTEGEVRLAFQPGKFEINLGSEKLKRLYERAEAFICNKEEAAKILRTDNDNNNVKKLLAGINKLGPKLVLITDGPKGAYFWDSGRIWFMPPYPDPKPPYERTGAGDAYGSTFVGALALGQSAEEALRWAAINAMSVVQQIGAQRGLLSQAAIEELLKKAPADYKPKKL